MDSPWRLRWFWSACSSGGKDTAFEGASSREATLRDQAFSYLRPRYLALGIVSFVAFYVAFKFAFLVFDATDLLERWVFELTPLALMGLPELQLAFLSAVVASVGVLLHASSLRRGQLLGTIVTVTMIVSLIVALSISPYNSDAVNLPRFAVLAALLASIPLNHMEVLRRVRSGRARADRPAPEVWSPPEPEVWGAPEPEVFDEAMSTLDEALDALDSAVSDTSPEVKNDVTITMLEGLLSDFDDHEERVIDPQEIRRRQAIFEKRIKSIDKRLEENLQDPDALFAKATHLSMLKEFERALDVLDQLAAVDSEYPGLWMFKARIYEMMGNLKMAKLSLERAEQ